jgi:transcriptional regulator with XRE-family HTH domain
VLSKRLKYLRKKKNLSQEGLSKLVNSTKGTISNYENEHSTPSNEMLVHLAEVLDTTTDYLLGKSVDQEKTSEDVFGVFLNNPELEVWYKELPNSTEEELKLLKEMFDILRKRNK